MEELLKRYGYSVTGGAGTQERELEKEGEESTETEEEEEEEEEEDEEEEDEEEEEEEDEEDVVRLEGGEKKRNEGNDEEEEEERFGVERDPPTAVVGGMGWRRAGKRKLESKSISSKAVEEEEEDRERVGGRLSKDAVHNSNREESVKKTRTDIGSLHTHTEASHPTDAGSSKRAAVIIESSSNVGPTPHCSTSHNDPSHPTHQSLRVPSYRRSAVSAASPGHKQLHRAYGGGGDGTVLLEGDGYKAHGLFPVSENNVSFWQPLLADNVAGSIECSEQFSSGMRLRIGGEGRRGGGGRRRGGEGEVVGSDGVLVVEEEEGVGSGFLESEKDGEQMGKKLAVSQERSIGMHGNLKKIAPNKRLNIEHVVRRVTLNSCSLVHSSPQVHS